MIDSVPHFYCMPPHSSHLLQPLDIGCFAVLKRSYGRMVEIKMRNGDMLRGNQVYRYDWFRSAFLFQPSGRTSVLAPQSNSTPRFNEICEENKIILICMPPHSSHLLQPLDIGCFAVLKRSYGRSIKLVDRKLFLIVSDLKASIRARGYASRKSSLSIY
jgi:hypothetical protein